MSDDELRAIASGTGSSDKKQEEEDLGDVQRMIEQAAKELQLDAEKTVEGIALEIFGIKNAFLFHFLFSADKSLTKITCHLLCSHLLAHRLCFLLICTLT